MGMLSGNKFNKTRLSYFNKFSGAIEINTELFAKMHGPQL